MSALNNIKSLNQRSNFMKIQRRILTTRETIRLMKPMKKRKKKSTRMNCSMNNNSLESASLAELQSFSSFRSLYVTLCLKRPINH